MDTYDKIENLLKKENKTKSELSKFLEITPQRLNNWLKRKSVPVEYLKDIANFFNVDIDYLLGNEVPITHYLPLIGSASCGVPTNHFYSDMGEYELVPVPAELYRDGRYFVKADGDSMLPKIKNGDLVLCDVNANIDNGNIIHYTINNEESGIKRVIFDENQKPIMLVPLNDKYQPIPIKEGDIVRMARCLKVISDL